MTRDIITNFKLRIGHLTRFININQHRITISLSIGECERDSIDGKQVLRISPLRSFESQPESGNRELRRFGSARPEWVR